MPTYEHKCNTCQHEWEDSYSIKVDPPKECPSCKAETVVRLISLGAKGVVELQGQELIDKLKGDAQKLKGEAASNEKVYANLLGEQKYQELQTKMDQKKRARR
jgi:putative FmdB family regulatory protein